jgi:hypothetical protein
MDAEKNQSNPHTAKIVAIGSVAAIILIGILILYTMQSPRQAAMPEQLTIASGSPEFSALTLVAKEKGFCAARAERDHPGLPDRGPCHE